MSLDLMIPDWSQNSPEYWKGLILQTPRDQLYACMSLPPIGTRLCDDAAMFLAIATALKGVGYVSPNPLVGAVLLDSDGCFLAAGAHLRVGEFHAEVSVIKQIQSTDLLQGASMFVTLEPCAHQGRTPSCAKMLATLGLQRVVVGAIDPFPKVDGQGLAILNAANIKTEIFTSWSSHCAHLAKVFFHNQKFQDVFVGLKVASDPAGVFAGESSKRFWITGERSRQMGHFLRLEYDAIIVGANTVLLDDPILNIRHPLIEGRTPLRIVLDPQGEVLRSKKSLRILHESNDLTILIVSDQIISNEKLESHVTLLKSPLNQSGHFDWSTIKSKLWERGIRSLLIEGGGGLYDTALSEGVVNEIHWFVAPERGLKGLKWEIPKNILEKYNSAGGICLGEDRLIEAGL